MNLLRLFFTPSTVPILPKNNNVDLDDDWYDCDKVDNSLQTAVFLKKEHNDSDIIDDSIEILEELEEIEEIEQHELTDSIEIVEEPLNIQQISDKELDAEIEPEMNSIKSSDEGGQTHSESAPYIFDESKLIPLEPIITEDIDLSLEDERYMIHIKDTDIFDVLLKEMNNLIDAAF